MYFVCCKFVWFNQFMYYFLYLFISHYFVFFFALSCEGETSNLKTILKKLVNIILEYFFLGMYIICFRMFFFVVSICSKRFPNAFKPPPPPLEPRLQGVQQMQSHEVRSSLEWIHTKHLAALRSRCCWIARRFCAQAQASACARHGEK